MRRLILGIVLAVPLLFANDIDLEVTNILNHNGNIAIGLYNKNDDTFANMTKYYKGVDLDIDDTKVIYKFKNIPNGTYAIAVVHDENENKKLDKNFLGVPTEGYGFSNNIRPTFRDAKFEESKFELKSNKNIIIKIGY